MTVKEIAGHLIGYTGALAILGTFVLEQKHKISSKTISYSVVNALGSALIIIGMFLSNTVNYPSLFLESAWAISALSTIHNLIKNKK